MTPNLESVTHMNLHTALVNRLHLTRNQHKYQKGPLLESDMVVKLINSGSGTEDYCLLAGSGMHNR